MAYRPRFPPQNYGYGGYNRNDYHQSNSMNRNSGPPPMMRNCNSNNIPPMPPALQRFAHNMAYAGRPPPFPANDPLMRPPPPFRAGGGGRHHPPHHNMNGGNRNVAYPPPYPGSDPNFFTPRDGPRMRFSSNAAAGNGGDRFFVPWNTRPKHFFGGANKAMRNNNHQAPSNRPPNFNQASAKFSPQKNDDKPKRKKNKKRKFSARPKEDSKKLKPWMTDEIYEEVRKKNEMYVKCKNEDKPELWQEFRLLRNRVSSLIKDAKLKGGFLTRKQKEEDDTERPFSCDTCDRAFISENELETHVKEHIKCDTDGCQFEAHPKVIELHKKMQHDTGYASTIMKLNTDEEIQKWREERKSHFPTADNIKKRQAERQEKMDRGEIVTPKDFGKFRKRTADQNRFSRNGCQRNGRRGRIGGGQERGTRLRYSFASQQLRPPTKRQKIELEVESNSDCDDDEHIKLHRFRGMVDNPCSASQVCSETDSSSVKIDELIDTERNTVSCSDSSSQLNESQQIVSSLVTLPIPENSPLHLDCQNSDICEPMKDKTAGESADVECPNSARVIQLNLRVERETTMNNQCSDDDNEGPEVLAIVRSREEESVLPTPPETIMSDVTNMEIQDVPSKEVPSDNPRQRAQRYRDRNEASFNQNLSTPKNSLLEKLLVKEITHERNVILQCVRYTVRNNFFMK